MKCLIVVDYQYDFVAEDGKLTASTPAIELDEKIYEKIIQNAKQDNKIFFTMDSHTENDWNNHPESKSFNMHCEAGQKGWQLYGKVGEFSPLCEDINNSGFAYVSKAGYCPKNGFLKHIASTYSTVEVVGVVTDICVLQTVIALYNTGVNEDNPIEIIVDSNCVASFNQSGHEQALKYMQNILGVKIL